MKEFPAVRSILQCQISCPKTRFLKTFFFCKGTNGPSASLCAAVSSTTHHGCLNSHKNHTRGVKGKKQTALSKGSFKAFCYCVCICAHSVSASVFAPPARLRVWRRLTLLVLYLSETLESQSDTYTVCTYMCIYIFIYRSRSWSIDR